MRVKWNNQTINIENKSNKKNEFYCDWNYYTIEILPDDFSRRWYKDLGENKKMWTVICTDPHGSYIVEGGFEGTMSQMLQICFDNIGYPLTDINEEYQIGW